MILPVGCITARFTQASHAAVSFNNAFRLHCNCTHARFPCEYMIESSLATPTWNRHSECFPIILHSLTKKSCPNHTLSISVFTTLPPPRHTAAEHQQFTSICVTMVPTIYL